MTTVVPGRSNYNSNLEMDWLTTFTITDSITNIFYLIDAFSDAESFSYTQLELGIMAQIYNQTENNIRIDLGNSAGTVFGNVESRLQGYLGSKSTFILPANVSILLIVSKTQENIISWVCMKENTTLETFAQN
jgi:hypothetical protein